MDAWIEIRIRLKGDPKLKRFYRKLEIQRPLAIGMLVELWFFAFQHALDGAIGHLDHRDIAAEMDWPEDRADELWTALTELGPPSPRYPDGEPGFVDPDGNLHKWGEFRLHYANLELKREEGREKVRKRVTKHRDKTSFRNALRNALVTACNGHNSKTSKTSKTLLPGLADVTPKGDKELGDEVDRLAKDFERFYTAFPRKKDKQAAISAWIQLRPDADTVEGILKAIAEQDRSDQWNRDRPKFIPYPATWLNKRRWEDDPDSAAGPPKGGARTGVWAKS